MVKNLPVMQDAWLRSLGWEDPWRKEEQPTPVFWPREFHGLGEPGGLLCTGSESELTEQLAH